MRHFQSHTARSREPYIQRGDTYIYIEVDRPVCNYIYLAQPRSLLCCPMYAVAFQCDGEENPFCYCGCRFGSVVVVAVLGFREGGGVMEVMVTYILLLL